MKDVESFPVEMKRGNVSVKIYRVATTKAGREYVEFRVGYYNPEGKRKFKTFADFEEARGEARSILDSVATGNLHALTLTNQDKAIYERAIDALRHCGTPLDIAAIEYADCRKSLSQGAIKAAVLEYVARHRGLKSPTVREVVDGLVKSKEDNKERGFSADYIKDLRSRLGRFADSFQCPIQSVGPEDVAAFLLTVDAGRTRFNYCRLIGTLFNYAKKIKCFPKDVDPLDGVSADYVDDGEIEIFTPEELTLVFKHAREEIIPFIAMGAFAGIRHKELQRLEWQDVDLKAGFITIPKRKAKNRHRGSAARRLIPISANLREWLTPYREKTGPIVPFENMSKQIDWMEEDIVAALKKEQGCKFAWKRNGLRHSFISYRLAIVQDAAKVALEAGNSAKQIFQNYREIVTPEKAAIWFSIVPAAPENLLPMPVAPSDDTKAVSTESDIQSLK